MNWSTRLRRWVRIRTPPVRVASMKPTAATVLPAPVACSNQKRRSAPGSSGASSTTSSSSSAGCSSQSCGSSSGASSSSSLLVAVLGAVVARRRRRVRRGASASLAARRRCRSRSPSAPPICCWPISSARVPERASTWCGFSSAPSRSFGGSSARKRSSPSSSEKSRRHWIEGFSAPSSSSFSAASRARRRAVPGASASGPSPSSRKGSRANAAARSMSALEGTAASAATSLVLAIEGFRDSVPAATQTVRRGQVNEAAGLDSASPPSTQRDPRTANRTYVLYPLSGCLRDRDPSWRCARWLLAASSAAAAAAPTGGDYGGPHPDYAKALAGSPPPLAALHKQANELLGGGSRRLRKADRAAARLPGRRQRLGLLVRPLPAGVPGPAEALGPLRQEGRLPRRQLRRLRRRRRDLPRARSRSPTPATPTPTKRSSNRSAATAASPTPPSTTAPASSSTSNRAPTATSPNSKPTCAATPLQGG